MQLAWSDLEASTCCLSPILLWALFALQLGTAVEAQQFSHGVSSAITNSAVRVPCLRSDVPESGLCSMS